MLGIVSGHGLALIMLDELEGGNWPVGLGEVMSLMGSSIYEISSSR